MKKYTYWAPATLPSFAHVLAIKLPADSPLNRNIYNLHIESRISDLVRSASEYELMYCEDIAYFLRDYEAKSWPIQIMWSDRFGSILSGIDWDREILAKRLSQSNLRYSYSNATLASFIEVIS